MALKSDRYQRAHEALQNGVSRCDGCTYNTHDAESTTAGTPGRTNRITGKEKTEVFGLNKVRLENAALQKEITALKTQVAVLQDRFETSEQNRLRLLADIESKNSALEAAHIRFAQLSDVCDQLKAVGQEQEDLIADLKSELQKAKEAAAKKPVKKAATVKTKPTAKAVKPKTKPATKTVKTKTAATSKAKTLPKKSKAAKPVDGETLTTTEVAAATGLSGRKIRELAEYGKIKARRGKDGRSWLYDPAVVEALKKIKVAGA